MRSSFIIIVSGAVLFITQLHSEEIDVDTLLKKYQEGKKARNENAAEDIVRDGVRIIERKFSDIADGLKGPCVIFSRDSENKINSIKKKFEIVVELRVVSEKPKRIIDLVWNGEKISPLDSDGIKILKEKIGNAPKNAKILIFYTDAIYHPSGFPSDNHNYPAKPLSIEPDLTTIKEKELVLVLVSEGR